MMPNTSPSLDERVEELAWAVRMVYASTFSQQVLSRARTLARTRT